MTLAMEKAIPGGVKALPHTPIYRMHRYFARRPYNVISRLIEHYSKPGDIVVDPFCGGGTTCVAAKELRRRYIAYEIDKARAIMARKRLNDHGPAP